MIPVSAQARPEQAPPIALIAKALGVDSAASVSLDAHQHVVAKQAGSRLVSLCPDCRLSTIAEEGPCGWARANRRIIQQAVAQGMEEDTIVERYVATYGPEVLAVDTSSGRFVLTWLAPYVLVGVGLLVVFLVAARARRREEVDVVPDDIPDETNRAALDEALSELD